MGDQAVWVIVPLVVKGLAKLVEVGVARAAHKVVVAFPFAVQKAAHFRRLLQKNDTLNDKLDLVYIIRTKL